MTERRFIAITRLDKTIDDFLDICRIFEIKGLLRNTRNTRKGKNDRTGGDTDTKSAAKSRRRCLNPMH